jgi:pyruvate dehydrogenase E2 component (dihydrolipoamide acetyltransferase)
MAFEFTEDALLAKILRPEGSTEVAVGDVIAITVEDAKDVAAFKDYKLEAAPAATPAPAAPKAAEAPKLAKVAAPMPAKAAAPAAAPAPKPAAAPAAPAAPAAAAVGSEAPYLSFDAWGTSLKRAPIGAALARQQNAYAAMFGYTGFDPLPLPEEAGAKKEKPAAAAK